MYKTCYNIYTCLNDSSHLLFFPEKKSSLIDLGLIGLTLRKLRIAVKTFMLVHVA